MQEWNQAHDTQKNAISSFSGPDSINAILYAILYCCSKNNLGYGSCDGSNAVAHIQEIYLCVGYEPPAIGTLYLILFHFLSLYLFFRRVSRFSSLSLFQFPSHIPQFLFPARGFLWGDFRCFLFSFFFFFSIYFYLPLSLCGPLETLSCFFPHTPLSQYWTLPCYPCRNRRVCWTHFFLNPLNYRGSTVIWSGLKLFWCFKTIIYPHLSFWLIFVHFHSAVRKRLPLDLIIAILICFSSYYN